MELGVPCLPKKWPWKKLSTISHIPENEGERKFYTDVFRWLRHLGKQQQQRDRDLRGTTNCGLCYLAGKQVLTGDLFQLLNISVFKNVLKSKCLLNIYWMLNNYILKRIMEFRSLLVVWQTQDLVAFNLPTRHDKQLWTTWGKSATSCSSA